MSKTRSTFPADPDKQPDNGTNPEGFGEAPQKPLSGAPLERLDQRLGRRDLRGSRQACPQSGRKEHGQGKRVSGATRRQGQAAAGRSGREREETAKPTKSSRGTSIGKADSARERASGGLNPVAGLDMTLEEAEKLEAELKEHKKDNKKKSAAKESQFGELTGNQGATATVEALSALIESGNPLHKNGELWIPHRPERPPKSEGGVEIVLKSDYEPQGRPADRHCRTGGGHRHRRTDPGAARRHRLGQDLHHGAGDLSALSARR